ncbi:MAG: orotidine-5'-phosphate decarboxylase [candidate division WOR-3 bacterium]|nr:orotidine-5'-phosphate decarboxylase [candidate division WOR-3 bacterium]MCX7757670.1 orotidine-5'-phosphate decarboxylase [candidate division WOR-3 bacterium]MDW7987474.1 orotidine-5'-phosphate decarboxylase [candidate division WOR-3 bacterium]
MTKLILALQADTLQKAKKIYQKTKGWIDVYKVGIDLFTRTGPSIVNYLVRNNKEEVFLDLKFCDIPSIVSKAVLNSIRLGISMLTIHTTGGVEMMKKTSETVKEYCAKHHLKKSPLILGVTILTSISEKEFGYLWTKRTSRNLASQVLHLAYLAKKAGLDGVVASAHEVKAIKKECGPEFIVVVPGIRISPPETEIIEETKKITHDDQVRFETPSYAAKNGADYIVVGRPIIQAIDPIAVIKKIHDELKV